MNEAPYLIASEVAKLRLSKDPQFYKLARGKEVLDALLLPVFHQLQNKLREKNLWVTEDQLAFSLLLLARIRTPMEGSFCSALAHKKCNEVRFSRWIRSASLPDLFRGTVRMLALCENKASPAELADIVCSWTGTTRDRMRVSLTRQFINATPFKD